jgi:O-antigen biosynthesis protein
MTAPNDENPKGFWERKDVRGINDALLRGAGLEWDRVLDFSMQRVPAAVLEQQRALARRVVLDLDAHRPWALKEPRFCFTLPFWREFLEVPVVAHVFRHPVEVAVSLRSRNGVPLSAGIAMWEAHVLSQLTLAAGMPEVFAFHHEVVADPICAAAALHAGLSNTGVRRLELPSASELNRFVDPRLYRSRPASADGAYLADEPAEVWDVICRGEFDALRGRELSDRSRRTLSDFEDQARQLREALDARRAVEQQATRISAMESRLGEQASRVSEPLAQIAAGVRDLKESAATLQEIAAASHEAISRQEGSIARLSGLVEVRLHALTSECERTSAGFGVLEEQIQQQSDRLLALIRTELHADVERVREEIAGLLVERDAADRLRSQEFSDQCHGLVEEHRRSSAQQQALMTALQRVLRVAHEGDAVSEGLREAIADVDRAATLLERSLTWRLGRALTAPARWLRRSGPHALDYIHARVASETAPRSAMTTRVLEILRRAGQEEGVSAALMMAKQVPGGIMQPSSRPGLETASNQRDAADLAHRLNLASAAVDLLERSLTYRIGRLITWPIRWLKPSEGAIEHVRSLARGVEVGVAQACIPAETQPPQATVLRSRDVGQTCASGRIGIVVLTLDGAELLARLLQSLAQHLPSRSFVIAVTDHGSTDATKRVLDHWVDSLPIRVSYAGMNHSFSYSNNRWAEQLVDCEFLLFLNNDIVFKDGVIDRMADALRDPSVGIVGVAQQDCVSLGEEPTWHHRGIGFGWDAAHAFWRPFNIRTAPEGSPALLSRMPAVTGSVMMVRRGDFLALGGFHEGYVYGYEDVDLCLTMQSRLGKGSVCLHSDHVVHADGATRRKTPPEMVRDQRRSNIRLLASRHNQRLTRLYRASIAGDEPLKSAPPCVAFAVTEVGADAAAGDLFTAQELGHQLERQFGWHVEFRPRGDAWYDLAGIDIVVAMVDAYDPTRIKNAHPALLKVAWARNWFDRWCEREGHGEFDLFLASSSASADYMQRRLGQASRVLRIATNVAKFSRAGRPSRAGFDYVFTGSYWGVDREIVSALGALPGHLEGAIVGKNWDRVPALAHLDAGFRRYEELPDLYRHASIVIDDANHVTKPWGSVNSRVFDALAAGCLVVTNSAAASADGFDGELPVYTSPEHLAELVTRFCSDEAERRELQQRLYRHVHAHHTYARRAVQFRDHLLEQSARALRFGIKIPVPNRSLAAEWGDFHFASCLARELRRLGHRVRIDFLDEWERTEFLPDDVVLAIRGLSPYTPRPGPLNLIWLISHPDRVDDLELNEYDHVFAASIPYADELGRRLVAPVTPLLQCTDPTRFHPYPSGYGSVPASEVLFVGNSRLKYRPIVRAAIESGIPVDIYGTRWEGLVPSERIRGMNIPNEQVAGYYASAGVLLNDHWPDMAAKGFLSNRLFDAIACGARVVSDHCATIDDVFGGAVVVHRQDQPLQEAIAVAKTAEHENMLERASQLVLSHHTFADRARVISDLASRRLSSMPADTMPAEVGERAKAVGRV